jgi:hypothetical protein
MTAASILWSPPTEAAQPSAAFLRSAFNEDAFFTDGPSWGAAVSGSIAWTAATATDPTWSAA